MSGPMDTKGLIALIAADAATKQARTMPTLAHALAAGIVASLAVFLAELGIRPDFMDALVGWRLPAKLLLVVTALAIAISDCARLAAPTERAAMSRLNWLTAALLLVMLVAELATLPSSSWRASLIGHNATACLTFIPLMALAPLIAGLMAFRTAAPAEPAIAGAALGRLAAATGASLYALHCPDDSPLFVVVWYGLAAASITGLGALAGKRVLRW